MALQLRACVWCGEAPASPSPLNPPSLRRCCAAPAGCAHQGSSGQWAGPGRSVPAGGWEYLLGPTQLQAYSGPVALVVSRRVRCSGGGSSWLSPGCFRPPHAVIIAQAVALGSPSAVVADGWHCSFVPACGVGRLRPPLHRSTLQLGGDGEEFIGITSPDVVSAMLLSMSYSRTDRLAKHLAHKSLKCRS